jgi:superfamily II DNA or RNA helicase
MSNGERPTASVLAGMSVVAQTERVKVADVFSFSASELIAELGASTMERAVQIMRSDKPPRGLEPSPDGTRLTAVVPSATGRGAYHQTIILSRLGPKLKVKGYCTCAMGQNCKHVGAALLMQCAPSAVVDDDDGNGDDADTDEREVDFSDMARALREEITPQLPAVAPNVPKSAAGSLAVPVAAATQRWLARIAEAVTPPPRVLAKTNPRIMLYVLAPAPSPGVWTVRAVTASVASDGTAAMTSGDRTIAPDEVERLVAQGVRYIDEADTRILRECTWLRRGSANGQDTELKADAGSRRILERVLETGRACLATAEAGHQRLAAGPAVQATPTWTRTETGGQVLRFQPDDDQSAFEGVIATDPPYYVRGGLVGAITSALPPLLAIEVARAPLIGPAEAAVVKAELQRHATPMMKAGPETIDPSTGEIVPAVTAGTSLLPLPDSSQTVEVKRISPVPRLRLFMGDVRLKERFRWHAPEELRFKAFAMPLAELSFDYAGQTVLADDPRPHIEKSQGQSLLLMARDKDKEDAAAQRLKSTRFIPASQAVFDVQGLPRGVYWLRPRSDAGPYDMLDELDAPERFIAFSAEHIPRLMKAGWHVVFDAKYPYQIAEGDAEWWADVGEGKAGIDWFSFELGITYEGQRLNIIPQLASLIARLPPSVMALATKAGAEKEFARELARITLYANLPDGRLLKLPSDRLAPMLRGLLELIGPRADRIENGKVKLHRAEAATLASFSDLNKVAWAASAQRLVDLGRSLRRGKSLVAVNPPPDFKASLRPYQSDGLAWLDFLRDTGFGGVLADDMGLGKTVQGLAFLAREKADGRLTKPALIVAPTSVLPNWQAEAEKFAPNLSVLALRGLDRKALFEQIPAHDLVLTTYPLLARDHEVLLGHEFHVALLDEAQAIKNPKATITGIAHRINARHRFALTGTPLENNLGEVWSLFEFLSPGLLGDETSFKRVFRTPIEKHGDPVAQGFLSRRLKPFMLRRTKSQVAKELPPKTEIVERIQLEGAQRDLYETVRALMEKRVRAEIDKKGLAQSHIIFLDALLKLRQICCDPRLLKMDAAKKVKQSAKLERLMELLPEMVAEGRKILLFSQFTSMLDLIELELKREKIGFVTLRGDTTDRAIPVQEFQAGKVPVFLLSLKAGGTGLNLTAADTVIHYDPWWNPAVENQATDRAYRIGQDKPVFVHKLIVEDGIEDAIELLKMKKSALANALFEGASQAPMKLTEDDIAALFAPIGHGKTGGKRG